MNEKELLALAKRARTLSHDLVFLTVDVGNEQLKNHEIYKRLKKMNNNWVEIKSKLEGFQDRESLNKHRFIFYGDP